MTPERYQALARTYGAELRRWPEPEREAARAWAASQPASAAVILAEAAGLDALLATHALAAPSPALVRRIAGSAPRPRELWREARLWWSGLGLAGAGIAGLVAGVLVVSLLVANAVAPATPGEIAYASTAFSGAGPEGGDE